MNTNDVLLRRIVHLTYVAFDHSRCAEERAEAAREAMELLKHIGNG